jgi:hypothetical protein
LFVRTLGEPPVSHDCSVDIVSSRRVVGDFTVTLSRVARPGCVSRRERNLEWAMVAKFPYMRTYLALQY